MTEFYAWRDTTQGGWNNLSAGFEGVLDLPAQAIRRIDSSDVSK